MKKLDYEKFNYIDHTTFKRGRQKFGRIYYKDEQGKKKLFDCSLKNLDKYVSLFKHGVTFSEGWTLVNLCELYLSHRNKSVELRHHGISGIKESTHKTDSGWIKHIVKEFGNTQLDMIDRFWVQKTFVPFCHDFAISHNPKSAFKIYNYLERIIKFGDSRGYIKLCIFDKLFEGKLNYKSKKPDIPTIDEFNTIQKHCDYYFQVANFFIAVTGLRANELCALKWSNIDFKSKILRIHQTISNQTLDTTKTSNGIRETILPAKLLMELHRFKTYCDNQYNYETTEYIFPNQDGGFKNNNNLRRDKGSLQMACLKLKLVDENNRPKFTLQSLRQFFRTNMEIIYNQMHVSNKLLDYRFGHSPRSVAEKHYIDPKVMNQSENETVEVLANKLFLND